MPALAQSEPWRFLTSAFAHGGITHIAFNMYALWVMGSYLEPMLGRARFVAIYLLSALGGSVMYLLLSTPPTAAEVATGDYGMWWTGAVGASGRGVRPVRGVPRAPAPARPVVGRHVRDHRHQRRHRVRHPRASPGRPTSAGCSPGRPWPRRIAYSGRNRGPLEPAPNQRVHWFSMGGILLVLVVLTIGKYALAG